MSAPRYLEYSHLKLNQTHRPHHIWDISGVPLSCRRPSGSRLHLDGLHSPSCPSGVCSTALTPINSENHFLPISQPLSLAHLHYRSLNECVDDVVYNDDTIQTLWGCPPERRRKVLVKDICEKQLDCTKVLWSGGCEARCRKGTWFIVFPSLAAFSAAVINSVEEGSSDISQCDLTSQVQSRGAFLLKMKI